MATFKLPINPDATAMYNVGLSPRDAFDELDFKFKETPDHDAETNAYLASLDAFEHGGWSEPTIEELKPIPMSPPSPALSEARQVVERCRAELDAIAGALQVPDRGGDPTLAPRRPWCRTCAIRHREDEPHQGRTAECMARDLQVRKALAIFKMYKPSFVLVLDESPYTIFRYVADCDKVFTDHYPRRGEKFVYLNDFLRLHWIHPATCTCKQCRPDLYPRGE